MFDKGINLHRVRSMTMLQVLPLLAYAAIGMAILAVAARRRDAASTSWLIPAGVGVAFGAFTLLTLYREGFQQFWVNHSTTFAGNQVWFDLLIAVAISFYLLAPRARAQGMPLAPWAAAVVLTASVALLPMLARVLWLEQKSAR